MEIPKVSQPSFTTNTNHQHKQPTERKDVSNSEKDAQQERKLNPEEVQDMVKSLNETSETRVSFNVSEDSTYIQIKDENGEVIRDIPPEEIRNLRNRMDENSGVFLDTEV